MKPRVVRLHRAWSFYRRDGAVELSSYGTRRVMTLSNGPVDQVVRALDVLVDGVPVDSAAAAVGEASGLPVAAASKLVKTLLERGVLLNASPDSLHDDDSIYDRHIKFFELFERPGVSGEDLHRRLQESTVVIPGLGGAGTWIALECARMGIRNIIGIDSDIVEASNLGRQVLYTHDDVGKYKVDVCRDKVAGVDDRVNFDGRRVWIESYRDLIPHLENADFIFNTFSYTMRVVDTADYASSIALAALATNTASLPATTSWIGPFNVPGQTACLYCVSLAFDVTSALQRSYPIRQDRAGRMLPRIVATASLAVWEMVRHVSGMDWSRTHDGVVALDTMGYEHFGFTPIARNPDCPWCGDSVWSSDGRWTPAALPELPWKVRSEAEGFSGHPAEPQPVAV